MHGEDEASGRTFLMLEGIDARVHFIYHNVEIESARASGWLKNKSLARLSQGVTNDKPWMTVEDSGDSEVLLRDKHRVRSIAAHC